MIVMKCNGMVRISWLAHAAVVSTKDTVCRVGAFQAKGIHLFNQGIHSL